MTRLYAYLAGVLVLIVIAFGLYAWGRSDGREAQRKDDAALIERKNAALRDAATALGADAVRFREINALSAQAKAEAEAQSKLAAELARLAGKEQSELIERIADLEDRLEAERGTCTEAEMAICGTPLR